jgi:NAD(P)-dependent dehydrogenase (short-subunit alcohol dehydrogenase family)
MIDLQLDNKCVVVTGGAGGIGAAVAHAFASQGADIVLLDRDELRLTSVGDDVRAHGRSVETRTLDVADPVAVTAAFESMSAPVDILVSTAGVISYASLLEQSIDDLDRMIDINLRGTYAVLQEAARAMARAGSGSIVNIASTAAFVAARLPAAAYAMTKAGVRHLTTAAAAELAPLGIRVNAVAPSTVDTPFVKGTLDTPEQRAAAASHSPLGRIAQPDDIASAVLFLASPMASFITGHTLVVDGGKLTRSS